MVFCINFWTSIEQPILENRQKISQNSNYMYIQLYAVSVCDKFLGNRSPTKIDINLISHSIRCLN
jgi:hypothetical protein